MVQQEKDGIILAGCGHFGSFLAAQLELSNKHIVVIDTNALNFERLASGFSGSTLQGDASNIEVLHQSGVRNARVLIAATDDDNINLMIAQIAREIYEVPIVMALVANIDRFSMKNEYNFHILCPAVILAHSIMRELIAQETGEH